MCERGERIKKKIGEIYERNPSAVINVCMFCREPIESWFHGSGCVCKSCIKRVNLRFCTGCKK